MQRIVNNFAALSLAASLVAGAAVAQDKAEKGSKKKETAAASAGSGRTTVNGVPIPQARIDAMNKELDAAGQPSGPERQAAIREELVNREILAQAAKSRGLDKNPDVQQQMEMARQAVLIRALFDQETKAHPITDADLEKQYNEFKGSMGQNENKVSHILVDNEADAKAIIDQLKKNPGDFAKIAKEKSKDPGSKDNGGDLDWGPSARYVKPFADAVQSQPKGQISQAPVKTDFGYHIIRVDDVRPLKVPDFKDLKDQFKQRAQQQQIQKLVADLRSKAKVEER